ncbi:hypothetical protein KW805_04705 [Candidatus Pacearchaeota archaeon]|nr:hypothetical protein [Candidatus Pacearchaeota archaeon]
MKVRYSSPLAFLSLIPFASADIVSPRGLDLLARLSPVYVIPSFLIINFIINLVIIQILLYAFKNFKKTGGIKQIYRVIFITIIGMIIDWFAFATTGYVYGYYQGAFIVGSLVLVVAGTASYLLMFKKSLEKKQAIISSIVFGIISNPIWLYLLLLR